MRPGAVQLSRPAAGDVALTLDLAGLTVALASPDAAWREEARRRWAPFASDAPAALTVIHRPRGRRPDAAARARVRARPVREDAPGVLRGDGFTAVAGGGVVVVDGPPGVESVDALLPLLWQRRRRGLVVHGAMLELAGRGVLCLGPSGRGKSTLAALLGDAARCDELTAVLPAVGSAFTLAALPYWNARPGRAPLAAACVLAHAPAHRAHYLAPAGAFAALRSQVLWPRHGRRPLARAFADAAGVAGAVPFYRLAFAPRADVRATLESILADAADDPGIAP